MDEFKRIEFKYLIEDDTYEKFLKDLQEYVILDEYNKNNQFYKIGNIYYDSDSGYLARSAMIDPEYKFKVRLRIYESDPDKVYLELKEKQDGAVYKTRILINDILPCELDEMSSEKIKKIIQKYQLKPQSFIAYDRLAFFGKDDHDLRVTFDFNIFGHKYNTDTDGNIRLTNKIVLEVKSSNGIPQWLLLLLGKHRIHSQTFSKYVRFYKKERK